MQFVSWVFNLFFCAMDARFENILVEVYALFTRNGIKSTTMDDVARALGISKKTLYQFVNDKPDLVSSVIAYQIELDKNDCDKDLFYE